MKVNVKWLNAVAFEATTGSGHVLVMDGSAEYGGLNRGARPMELLLTGLAGCASFDIVTILQKARQDISDVSCHITAERKDAIPAVFTRVHLHFVVTGSNVQAKQVDKAVHLSADKYCSANRLFSDAGVEMQHTFEIINTTTEG